MAGKHRKNVGNRKKERKDRKRRRRVPRPEHSWKRSQGDGNGQAQQMPTLIILVGSSYESGNKDSDEDKASKRSQGDQEPTYTPQGPAPSRALKHEKDCISQLRGHDGEGKSLQKRNQAQISTDDQDQQPGPRQLAV